MNKIDLVNDSDGRLRKLPQLGLPVIKISAKTGVGIDSIMKHITTMDCVTPPSKVTSEGIYPRTPKRKFSAYELMPNFFVDPKDAQIIEYKVKSKKMVK